MFHYAFPLLKLLVQDYIRLLIALMQSTEAVQKLLPSYNVIERKMIKCIGSNHFTHN